jgi:tyrosyl-tRNA synthetase
MAMMIAITQGGVTATLDWERVADAARDEFDKTVSQVIDEPVARTDVEHLKDEEMDALRVIVAKIVREELKGHLGEKITAKIRQMLQREIKAALDEHQK